MTVTMPPPVDTAKRGPVASAEQRNRAVTWLVIALAAIWIGVVFISVFAPDNVSGAQQEHLAIAAILTWIWGLLASRTVAPTAIRHRDAPDVGDTVRLMALAVVPIWAIATVVGVFGPVLVTGTDPTRLPLAAIIAPIAAMVLTQAVVQLVSAMQRPADATSDNP